jgi:glucose-1-phosphate adenylyltransferase
VRVHSYCDISGSVILPKVTVNRNVVLKNVVIDRGCNIPEGMQIGINLAEDKKRFYVSEKGITLVTPDMLGQDLYRVK